MIKGILRKQRQRIRKLNENVKIVLLMIIAYAFLLIGVANSYPMHTTTDELGALVGAARLAGLDWSGVISNSGYYGFGYYSLFFFLFKFTDSPVFIYRSIVVITVVFRVLIIPIAYYILKNYLGVKAGAYLYLISFLMPFLHTSTVGVISNEDILIFLIWLILLLMCKSTSASALKELVIYFSLLVGVCFYSLLIHTRALTMLIALVIVYFVYGIVHRERKSLFVIFGVPVIYILSKKIIILYQQAIYGTNGGKVRNASVAISDFNIFDKKTWDVWFHMFIGMLDTEAIITGGLFLVAIVTVLCYVIRLIKGKKRMLSVQGNMVLAVTVLCIGATIAAFLVSTWFAGMRSTWGEAEASKQYVYKGLTYVRYWDIYVPPLLMCALSILPRLHYRKIVNRSMITLVIMHIIFIHKLIPLVKYNMNCASFLYGVGHYNEGVQVTEEYYLKCIAISLIATFAAYAIVQTKKARFAVSIFIAFMMVFHFNKQTEYNLTVKEKVSQKISASYEEKCRLDARDIDIGTIYLNDETGETDRNWMIYSVAQFYLNRYTLEMELPAQLKENDIIISTCRSSDIESRYDNIYCFVLDDNEIWYTYLDLNQ